MCVGIQEDFYFKAEGAHLLVFPADETLSAPCDAQLEELDIALAIDRFQSVCDLPVDRIQSRWAGLRTFAPDGNVVVGADPRLAGLRDRAVTVFKARRQWRTSSANCCAKKPCLGPRPHCWRS